MDTFKKFQDEILCWVGFVTLFILLTVYSARYDSVRKSSARKSDFQIKEGQKKSLEPNARVSGITVVLNQ